MDTSHFIALWHSNIVENCIKYQVNYCGTLWLIATLSLWALIVFQYFFGGWKSSSYVIASKNLNSYLSFVIIHSAFGTILINLYRESILKISRSVFFCRAPFPCTYVNKGKWARKFTTFFQIPWTREIPRACLQPSPWTKFHYQFSVRGFTARKTKARIWKCRVNFWSSGWSHPEWFWKM